MTAGCARCLCGTAADARQKLAAVQYAVTYYLEKVGELEERISAGELNRLNKQTAEKWITELEAVQQMAGHVVGMVDLIDAAHGGGIDSALKKKGGKGSV